MNQPQSGRSGGYERLTPEIVVDGGTTGAPYGAPIYAAATAQ